MHPAGMMVRLSLLVVLMLAAVSCSTPAPTPPPPTVAPAAVPPTAAPTAAPKPTEAPKPTVAPTVAPTTAPVAVAPTVAPTAVPKPTEAPKPTVAPTVAPTTAPTAAPTVAPTVAPKPTVAPTAASSGASTSDAIVRVSQKDLNDMITAKKSVLIVDVRPKTDFTKGHIPGAVSLPWDFDISKPAAQVLPDKSKSIITYCDCGPGESDSAEIAKQLLKLSYTDVKTLADGWSVWVKNGYPVEK